MTEIEVDGVPVLFVRRGAGVTALEARCPHYGAPLAEGVLSGERIVCPWHHACFSARTGGLFEPPALRGLVRYPVRVDGDRILVSLEPFSGHDRQSDDPAQACPAAGEVEQDVHGTGDPRTFVVCGAGAAGTNAAMALRARGFRGRVILIDADPELPYDRTLLSKEWMQGSDLPSPFALRPDSCWRDLGIELWTNTLIERLDVGARTIATEDGTTIAYDEALVATGGVPKRIDVPGSDLPGIITLRSRADAERIVDAASTNGPVAMVGASFIALECAWSLRKRGIDVAVIAPEKTPFEGLFGPRVGARLLGVQRELGTRLHLGTSIERFEGSTRVSHAVLGTGDRIEVGTVVLGLGIAPATGFLAGIELEADGSMAVDAGLRAAPGLHAAGDVASFPVPPANARARIEHWRLACQHGRLAAHNMLGAGETYTGVPFFWSAQELALYYVGHASAFDEIVYDGTPEDGPFIAYYLAGGRLLAALGVQRNAEMAAIEELMRRQQLPDSKMLRAGQFDPRDMLHEIGP